jgi:hypothetical protein
MAQSVYIGVAEISDISTRCPMRQAITLITTSQPYKKGEKAGALSPFWL